MSAPDFEEPFDHPIHRAAEGGHARQVRGLLDAEPALVGRLDRAGGTPLHRAVLGHAHAVVTLLLDRGADIHAQYGKGRPAFTSYPPQYSEPIDMALWGGARSVHDAMWRNAWNWVRWCLIWRFRKPRPGPLGLKMARLLLDRGAS